MSGKTGQGMSFHTKSEMVSDCNNQESKEDLEKKYGWTYREYATKVVKQIMDYT